MAAADNASVLRAVYDAANAKDMEKVASYATPDAQDFMVPFEMKGGFRENWEAWAETFPDGMIEVKTLVAEGDYVVAETVMRGTHTGKAITMPTGEIPATERCVELPAVEVYRFQGGKIVEDRVYFDGFSFLKQLGVGETARGAEAQGEEATGQP